MVKKYLLLFLLSVHLSTFAQNKAIDSLRALIPKLPEDSNKVNALTKLCDAFDSTTADYKSVIRYANEAVQLAKKINFKTGLANAYLKLGRGYSYDTFFNDTIVNYTKGLNTYFEGEKVAQEISNKKLLASIWYEIGDDLEYQSHYQEALGYFLKADRYAEEIQNSLISINAKTRIGRIYRNFSDLPNAEKYFSAALSLSQKGGDTLSVIKTLLAVGNLQSVKKQHATSIQTFLRALALAKIKKDSIFTSMALLDLGSCYSMDAEYDKALDYFFQGYEYLKAADNQRRAIAELWCDIGYVYFKQNKYESAIEYYKKSEELYIKIGAQDGVAEAEKSLAEAYETLGNYKIAFEFYQKAQEIKDKIRDYQKTSEMTQHEMQYEYDKKDAIQKAEESHELAHQKLILNSFIAGIILVLAFGFVILRSYNQKKKANEIISLKKLETEKQKEIVEEKNREIISSISYAKRIQSAILPAPTDFKNKFADAFVFFKPKDIVSGDFYWLQEKDNFIFYAVADCTGHGVPGGFMSILGSSLLNELVLERAITEPAEILNVLRTKIIHALKQKGVIGENQDGMDIVICRIDKQTNKLTYAAANNPVWVSSNGVLAEYPCDKQPVGISVVNTHPFTQTEIELLQGDQVYIFSDGFKDQFGGSEGKKFKNAGLRELVNSIHAFPSEEQRNILEKTFDDWKGNFEQVDDVSVIGIKI